MALWIARKLLQPISVEQLDLPLKGEAMFDVGDGGLGFQLELYRWADTFKENSLDRAEQVLRTQVGRLADDNRQLVAYAERLERELKERNEQLAASQAALADARERLAYEERSSRNIALARLDRAKERERERDREKAARSQQP